MHVNKNPGKKRRVTRDDVARSAGVSPPTVSRALNDHPSLPKETCKRIKDLAERLGYTPSALGRSHFQGRSFRLAVVIPFHRDNQGLQTLPKEYFSQVLMGATLTAIEKSYDIAIVPDDGLSASQLIDKVRRKVADGLIVLGGRTHDTRFDEFLKQEIPFVLVHHYAEGKSYAFVDVDPVPGYREAFEHLERLGTGSLCFLGHNQDFINLVEREKIVTELSFERNWKQLESLPGDFSLGSGSRAAALLLAKKTLPDAILCGNDRMACGLIQGLRHAGLKVPRDIRVVGFDNQELANIYHPSITTIDNPFFELGHLAADQLVAQIEHQPTRNIRLPSKLILRESA